VKIAETLADSCRLKGYFSLVLGDYECLHADQIYAGQFLITDFDTFAQQGGKQSFN
jgi:hypothetical protein